MNKDGLELLLSGHNYRYLEDVKENAEIDMFEVDIDLPGGVYIWFQDDVNCLRLFMPRIIEVYEAVLPFAYKEINTLNFESFYGALSITGSKEKDNEQVKYFLNYINAVPLAREEGIYLSSEEFDEYITYIRYYVSKAIKSLSDIERSFTNGLNV
ncbi:hypothetical protein NSQ91_14050 [Paenibacillus sp. FSL R7-0048]|uniref:hypothetical protein n=1 Tax=Paenibacillus TaxID=44249 RepID=UPI00096BF984|nr:hypothetical protein [Paenibacillus odorifer]OMD87810.1 hypothetical protein BSK53_02135 [Paenibacillus odorifer]